MNIKNVLIAGGGMMGKNIAFVFASNPDFKIAVYDLYPTDVYGGIRTNTKYIPIIIIQKFFFAQRI